MGKFEKLYDKHYKKAILVPIIILLLSLGYLTYFYMQNGDIMKKDVSLTGGTSITLFGNFSLEEVSNILSEEFSDIAISTISDSLGQTSGVVILVAGESPEKIQNIIEDKLNIKLTEENSSVEFTGSELSQGFYSQLTRALAFAFILMALVIFFVFGENKKIKIYATILTAIAARLTFPISNQIGFILFLLVVGFFIWGLVSMKTIKEIGILIGLFILFVVLFFFPIYLFIIPVSIAIIALFSIYSVQSILIILSVFANLVNSLALANILGISISSAGIVAFLMLVGYSVDDNVLLTSKVNRRKGSINPAIFDAFKTAIMMVSTSFLAVAIAFVLLHRFESILNQIFLIIMFGLSFDLINTWMGYSGAIKWYEERKR